MFHGQIHTLDFGTYQASIVLYNYDQIHISDMCKILIRYKTTMMMMKCKHHESDISFGIEPNGLTKKWEHTSVQAYC